MSMEQKEKSQEEVENGRDSFIGYTLHTLSLTALSYYSSLISFNFFFLSGNSVEIKVT